MSYKKKETKVLCPTCGTEFAIPQNEFTGIATVVGKDSGLGIVYPVVANQDMQVKPIKTAQERIEALRNAGVDVSNMFSMKGADGGECIASNRNGKLSILDDNDPIFNYIIAQGTIPNRRLFRRWVLAKMFYMMSYTPCHSNEPVGMTDMIHRLGYEYQWKMLMGELYAQMKMEGRDRENFVDRNRWFNVDVVTDMAEDYIRKLRKHVGTLKERNCKSISYKRICNRDIFVSDLEKKLYNPLRLAVSTIKHAKNASQLYNATKKFNDKRIRMAWGTPQNKAWVDAYKGAGAYFSMQNLIRFHNCVVVGDNGKRLNKLESLIFISGKAEMYKDGEGWRLFAFLKKMLTDNNINIKKKMAEWRKKR